MVTAATKLKDTFSLEEKLWSSDICHLIKVMSKWQHIKKQRHHFADKGLYNPSYHFSSSQERMWELDHKEGWEPKNWCFQTVELEKTLESLMTAKRSNQSNLKEINLEYSLEGLILKLAYFGHLMWKANNWKRPWCWQRLKAKGEEGSRGWDG